MHNDIAMLLEMQHYCGIFVEPWIMNLLKPRHMDAVWCCRLYQVKYMAMLLAAYILYA